MAECLARLGKLTLHASLKRILLDDHREAAEVLSVTIAAPQIRKMTTGPRKPLEIFDAFSS